MSRDLLVKASGHLQHSVIQKKSIDYYFVMNRYYSTCVCSIMRSLFLEGALLCGEFQHLNQLFVDKAGHYFDLTIDDRVIGHGLQCMHSKVCRLRAAFSDYSTQAFTC